MREITTHVVNPANERLKIEVLDEPGSGGANHLYHITGFDSATNASDPWTARYGESAKHSTILFQNGPIGVDGNGVNGVTHEALLAIIIDRLTAFQEGPYACEANAVALGKLKEAVDWLNIRTKTRMARGVEGTHKV